ncbi:MAG: aminopeptidase [Acidobacteriota bacterium]
MSGDPRHQRLADLLLDYSCAVQPGETVFIEAVDTPASFVNLLLRGVAQRDAVPLLRLDSQEVRRVQLQVASEAQLKAQAAADLELMRRADAYIGIRGADNASELSDVPSERMRLYETHHFRPVHLELRVPKTRWVVLRWPSPAMAQAARRSTAAFEDFYFDVTTFDYPRLSKAAEPLHQLMEASDRVRLVAPGTDLRFNIGGIPAVRCDGHRNIPDGEVFTAPIIDSVEGTIAFNTPSAYHGVVHDGVRFTFREGKIVDASSSQPEQLASLLDADEGARYIGEFALGFHPLIREPMLDTLFDEKIAGSLHFTPGNAYESADNGNRSKIHWDLVLRMLPEHGGGEVWFDDRLIRKDGRFVVPELEGLNPDVLTGDAS